MHLAIFGATGRTGRPLIEQALAEGHTITALARTPNTLSPARDGLTVVRGDATDAEAVTRTVEGADAVLMALGHTKTSSKDVLSRATGHVVRAMKQHGVQRVITLTGAGVAAPNDPPGLAPTIIRAIMRTVTGDLLRDSERHVEILRQSGLDWTAVRGPRLTEDPATGRYETGRFAMGFGSSASRADVADYMLRLAQSDSDGDRMPMIRNT
ncbi:MAG: NAD(P)H-binding protein [Bacteroidota bacterium]